MGSKPGIYADGLLKGGPFCVDSPLTCVAGITGASLAHRVRSIVTLRAARLTQARSLFHISRIASSSSSPSGTAGLGLFAKYQVR